MRPLFPSGSGIRTKPPPKEYSPTVDWGEPSDKPPRWKGHGNVETLDAVNILQAAGITSCVVGIGALKYYGAGRVLQNWEICVPTEDFARAIELFKSPPYDKMYGIVPPVGLYPCSMLHAFPLSNPKGTLSWFHIIPSEDCHIECVSSNIEHTQNGLPYPKLHIFAQSLLATNEQVNLTDLIDGMDLDEAWGQQNLDLRGTNDVAWGREKNQRINASLTEDDPVMARIATNAVSCAETWKGIVSTKESRIGIELPKEYFLTRFRPKGYGDPRERNRPFV